MANIQLNVNSKKNPANLNIRFYSGRKINCYAKSNILIDPKIWSNKMQGLKPSADQKLKRFYNEMIQNLKNEILIAFNSDFYNGVDINSEWLNITVSKISNRPKDENDYHIYLIPYIIKYIEDSKKRINPKTGKKISIKTIQKYNTTKSQIEEFELFQNKKLRHLDLDMQFHAKFTSYLKIERKYSNTLIEKIISQLKTFERSAKSEGIETNPEIDSKRFSFKRDETIDTYLNEKEINLIFKQDLTSTIKLDNVRDLFIIGLRTGLRISDLKRIHDYELSSNRIKIVGTHKTDSPVEIPIHPQVMDIINKRKGSFPKIISDQKFNEYVKDVCQLAGLTQMTLGNIKTKDSNNRKIRGYYPKYQLITSHTCRRSFATNLYGKLDDKTIMAITTHRSHSQFLSYVKTTQSEHVEKLEKYWSLQE